MGELHTHTCPECSKSATCALDCGVEPGADGDPYLCEACDVAYRYGPVFQEGGRVIAADTGYVYEVLGIAPSQLQPFGRPGWRAAELRSVPGYPDETRTVHIDRAGRPFDYGDEHTSWELAKKP